MGVNCSNSNLRLDVWINMDCTGWPKSQKNCQNSKVDDVDMNKDNSLNKTHAKLIASVRKSNCNLFATTNIPIGHFMIPIIFMSHFVFAVLHHFFLFKYSINQIQWIVRLKVSNIMETKHSKTCLAINFIESTAQYTPNWVPKVYILIIIVIIIANIKLTSVTLYARIRFNCTRSGISKNSE